MASQVWARDSSLGRCLDLAECIPSWYHLGMSTQVAVRLPDDIVEFVDHLVADGEASSRAAVVVRALQRERRRLVAERDARIYAESGEASDLAGLGEWAAAQPVDLD